MFIDNKYTRIYFELMHSRKNMKRDVSYIERHHVLPFSMAPELDKAEFNIVELTAREHFIAHWLLTKMCKSTPDKMKMVYAFNMFRRKSNNGRILTSSQYEIVKKVFSKSMKENNPSTRPDVAKKISEAHKGKIFTDEHKANISRGKTGKAFNITKKAASQYESMKGTKIISKEGFKDKRVTLADIDLYIADGWSLGGKSRGAGQKWVNLNGKRTKVVAHELDEYLKNGWSLGRG